MRCRNMRIAGTDTVWHATRELFEMSGRLTDVVRYSPSYDVEILHAKNDPLVPWFISNVFFKHAISTAIDTKIGEDDFDKEKRRRNIDMDEGGWYVEWPISRGLIRQGVMRYGVHEKILSHPQITIVVTRAFQSRDRTPGEVS